MSLLDDFFHLGSSLSVRCFARLGSSMSVFDHVRIGSIGSFPFFFFVFFWFNLYWFSSMPMPEALLVRVCLCLFSVCLWCMYVLYVCDVCDYVCM